MSISTTSRKAGPYIGTNAVAAFPFAFKVFAPSDVLVVRTTVATGVETTLALGTDYTVALNANQDVSPGGTVTLSGALQSTHTLTIGSRVADVQPAVFTNQGRFYPTVLNDALDRLTIIVQQLREQVGRAVKTGFSSTVSPDQLLQNIYGSVDAAAGSASAAAASQASAAAQASAAGASASLAAGYADSVNPASFVKRDGTQPPTAPLTVPNGTAAGHAVNKGQLDEAVAAALPAGIFIRAAWVTPPAGFRVLRANGQAVSLATYSGLQSIYCGDSRNADAQWGYRCTDSANPSTTRSTTGGYIVLPKTHGRYARDLGDGTGIADGMDLYTYYADELRAHNHPYQWFPGEGNGEYDNDWQAGHIQQTGWTGLTGGAETRPYTYFSTVWVTY